MSEEVSEVPNWLNELEAKREHRVKARLGHEAGAGAPCLLCVDKCPGLDLHFWRKICKICKCSKENHDVHDDDIYGWAQFQLLGSRPNKIRRKIVLPGKRDEVELDWTPKGHNDTVEKFLQTLPPESLPVKGSQAAQDRKQLLQKQIPIHDIDPSLCHDLTELELKKMHDYIEHVKNSSVGVGHVVQLGMPFKGTLHQFDPVNASIVSSRCGQNLPIVETIGRGAPSLTNSLKAMNLGPKNTPRYDPEHHNIEEVNQTGRNFHIKDLNYGPGINNEYGSGIIDNMGFKYNDTNTEYGPEVTKNLATSYIAGNSPEYGPDGFKAKTNLPHYAPGKLNILNENQTPTEIKMKDKYNYNVPENSETTEYGSGIKSDIIKPFGNIKDLALSTFDPSSPSEDNRNNNFERKGLRNLNPANYNVSESTVKPDLINIGAIHDIYYPGTAPDVKMAQQVTQHHDLEPHHQQVASNLTADEQYCHRCKKPFKNEEFAISIERNNALYHSNCFKCIGCNQNLADMVYFYDKSSDDVYCGRDYAKIRGIPRCKACDELIFVKEYCLAENSTFHVKHFCCFECDVALAGQNYVIEDGQPVCLPCYESLKAEKCSSCGEVIKPDEQGANLNGIHFHADDRCFTCQVCRKPLLGAKILLKNGKLICSRECYAIL